MRPLSRHLKGNRKFLFIIGGMGLILLLAGGYLWWSATSWSNYHQSYTDWKSSTKTIVNEALALRAETGKEQTAKLEKLAAVSAIIASKRPVCTPSNATAWQKSLNGRYREWQKECQQLLSSVDLLNSTLKDIVAYTKSDHQLAKILTPVLKISDKKVTETDFVSVLDKWKMAAAEIKVMKVRGAFAPVKAKAEAAMKGIETAWRALEVAHKAKDESKYERAIRQLASAYTSLETIKAQSDKQSKQLGKTLQEQYDTVF